jgi:hypothetical protein
MGLKFNPTTGKLDMTGGGGSGSPAGNDTEIQLNNNGSFGAETGFEYHDDTLFAPGIVNVGGEATNAYSSFQVRRPDINSVYILLGNSETGGYDWVYGATAYNNGLMGGGCFPFYVLNSAELGEALIYYIDGHTGDVHYKYGMTIDDALQVDGYSQFNDDVDITGDHKLSINLDHTDELSDSHISILNYSNYSDVDHTGTGVAEVSIVGDHYLGNISHSYRLVITTSEDYNSTMDIYRDGVYYTSSNIDTEPLDFDTSINSGLQVQFSSVYPDLVVGDEYSFNLVAANPFKIYDNAGNIKMALTHRGGLGLGMEPDDTYQIKVKGKEWYILGQDRNSGADSDKHEVIDWNGKFSVELIHTALDQKISSIGAYDRSIYVSVNQEDGEGGYTNELSELQLGRNDAWFAQLPSRLSGSGEETRYEFNAQNHQLNSNGDGYNAYDFKFRDSKEKAYGARNLIRAYDVDNSLETFYLGYRGDLSLGESNITADAFLNVKQRPRFSGINSIMTGEQNDFHLTNYYNYDYESTNTFVVEIDGSGSTAPKWVSAKLNNGLDFSSSSQIVRIPNLSSLTTFSVSFWIKRRRTSTGDDTERILMPDVFGGWGIYIQSDNKVYFGKVGSWGQASSITLADTDWHFVVISYNGTDIKFTIDNTDAGTVTQSDSFGSTGDYVFGHPSYGGNLMATLDEFIIWNKVLSTAEKTAQWNSGTGLEETSANTDILCGWHFNETTGDVADDFMSAGYDGTLSGFTATDTFRWSNDGGSSWAEEFQPCIDSSSPKTIDGTLTFYWDATIGHSLGDRWEFTCYYDADIFKLKKYDDSEVFRVSYRGDVYADRTIEAGTSSGNNVFKGVTELRSNFSGGGSTFFLNNEDTTGDVAFDFYSGGSVVTNIALSLQDSENQRMTIMSWNPYGHNLTLLEAKDGNVGVWTDSPQYPLDVDGQIYASGDIESISGIVLTSPDTSRWRITVEDDGALTTTKIV